LLAYLVPRLVRSEKLVTDRQPIARAAVITNLELHHVERIEAGSLNFQSGELLDQPLANRVALVLVIYRASLLFQLQSAADT